MPKRPCPRPSEASHGITMGERSEHTRAVRRWQGEAAQAKGRREGAGETKHSTERVTTGGGSVSGR